MPRIIEAFAQFFDGSGDPLANGWLRFTESGTNNTDKNTYKDSSESIPNTNPLQLDAEGRCPSVFGSGTYRVTSYTNDEILTQPAQQLQQFDPVGGSTGTAAFDDWNALSLYQTSDIVTASNGRYFRSIGDDNIGNEPSVSPSEWEEVTFFVGGAVPGDLIGDVKAENSTIVLQNGTDGTDATITADVVADDGTVILAHGTDGTDSTYTGDVTGDLTGNVTGNVTGDVTGDLTGNADSATTLTGLTSSVAELNILDGVTADAAELNTMDGITATTTELNYTDGVTSPIQTQINTKAPTASPTFTGTVTAPTFSGDLTGNADTVTAVEDKLALNGDFTGGSIVYSKVGNLVTLTSSGTITHASSSNVFSAAGLLPVGIRPSESIVFSSRVWNVGVSMAEQISINNNGSITVSYENLATGGGQVRTGTSRFSISYLITANIT